MVMLYFRTGSLIPVNNSSNSSFMNCDLSHILLVRDTVGELFDIVDQTLILQTKIMFVFKLIRVIRVIDKVCSFYCSSP